MDNKLQAGIDLEEKSLQIIGILRKQYPDATIALSFRTPFELLVATILSAQCTDKRVNEITTELFQSYSTPRDFANIQKDELEHLIFSAGFYKMKAKHIIESAIMIEEKFGGKVPDSMEELITLPGVGRKTANVVLGHCFGIPGIVVDTHVKRISTRLGLASGNTPEKVEYELMKVLPKDQWIAYNTLIISFGRDICSSQRPQCLRCPIIEFCIKPQLNHHD